MTVSWVISDGNELPLMLCAGVGSVVVVDAAEPVMLIIKSLALGENWEGLCGVCGWQDMMERGTCGCSDVGRGEQRRAWHDVAWLVATLDKEKSVQKARSTIEP